MDSSTRKRRRQHKSEDGEFLWLVSLSDLMILLFVFFVVLFSFSVKNMSASELLEAVAVLNGNPDTPIDEIERELKNALSVQGMSDFVDIKQQDGTLTMNIKDAILFESGQYHLKDQSRTLIRSMARIFTHIPSPYNIAIEGHTDDAPFSANSSAIDDNWRLSLMRAHEVFYNLSLSDELKTRASIVGYGPMKPRLPNKDERGAPINENRAKNRRVTIKVY